ncbi:MAG: hypothetical protein GTO45_41305 [Candidatus Aminicenantes bacterium]|nr:hypothetical protein [Candidatus Aminicenantes bacterium]NIM85043.1 hypothetical protein [Candidatus Aminicenantes bacterium]NIN24557.1 hypothetical protein [Candidatus Aminicenantes bacterium]NIN48321.1 hypothetical protein [Candidatus Aminicenantes bacterium]NIN91224.1 hypothetical protein [Candidatus Aminicenantes bacterium]
MQKKLTLSIEEDLVKFAHELSKKTKQSISHMIEQYLHSLKIQTKTSDLSTRTLGLYGILSDQPIPSKKELRKYFHEKSNH